MAKVNEDRQDERLLEFPKSFVLSVTPRNRIENIIFFDLNFHQNKSIRKIIRILVLLFWKFC